MPISLPSSNSEPLLIAVSPVMRALVETIPRIARKRTPVLVLGETGTGKTLLAHALHAASEHRKQPLVVVPCALLVEQKGAANPTECVSAVGAIHFEHALASLAAHGGTLVLEELLDLSLMWQAKLCHLLEKDWGNGAESQQQKPWNIWVIATSCGDVAQAVHDQRLRVDLYHRVCGIPLVVPPLRERSEDISPLVQHLMAGVEAREGKSDTAFTPAALRALQGYTWPGNVRELRHVVERSLLLARGPHIGVDALPPFLQHSQISSLPPMKFPKATLHAAVAAVERQLITTTLQRTVGNQTQAAQLLGISRRILGYKLRQYNLRQLRKK